MGDAIWEGVKYAKCEHGFSEPGTPVYNARAALQAHKSTFQFFQAALGVESADNDAFPIDPVCTHYDSTCAAHWQQCGGKHHHGPLCCREYSSCVKVNDYYSQCQPIDL